MTIIGSLRERFKHGGNQEQDSETNTPRTSRADERDVEEERAPQPEKKSWSERRADKAPKPESRVKRVWKEAVDEVRKEPSSSTYSDWNKQRKRDTYIKLRNKQHEQENKTAEQISKTFHEQRRAQAKATHQGEIAIDKQQLKAMKEDIKREKQSEKELKHPVYTQIKKTAKEKLASSGVEAYDASKRAGKKFKDKGNELAKITANSAGLAFREASDIASGSGGRGGGGGRVGRPPKTKTGRTTTMREFTPTQANMVAPTANASTLMGQSSGLSQMIQTQNVQDESSQKDWIGELKYGLGGEKQTDYYGTQNRQTVNTTRRNGKGNGLGLGMGLGSSQDYFKAPGTQSRQPAKRNSNGLGLGMGIGSTKDYLGGSKRTASTTKRNSNGLGLGLGLGSGKKIDYFGGGKKSNGILQTTKSKKTRYY